MRCWGVTADCPVALRAVPSAAAGGFRPPPADVKLVPSLIPDSKPSHFNKGFTSIKWPKIAVRLENSGTRSFRVRASEDASESQTTIAPLRLVSPTGQLLSQIMQTHFHLLPAAIDQQLERLQSDQDAQKDKKPSARRDLLYRRIAEVKEKERRRTLEEIIYCLILQKFMENDISMIPGLVPSSGPAGLVDSWPDQELKLEAVHSVEALEMIQSHLSLILRDRVVGPLNTIVQISKLKLGKLYAASIMYGYFLKRVDQRYQLERSMSTLPKGAKGLRIFEDLKPNPLWDLESMARISSDEDDDNSDGDENVYRLRSYVMYLDAETLQRYATIRSKESISLIEKQTQALFGRPDIRISEDGSLDTSIDDVVGIRFSGLTMLVMEAVAFGSFLWEAETYVESKYHFVTT